MAIYEIYIENASPEDISRIGAETYRQWASFAAGGNLTSLGDHIKNPTGKYASSIKTTNTPTSYTILSDDPVADILEYGHKSFNIGKKMLGNSASRLIPSQKFKNPGTGPILMTRRAVNAGKWTIPAFKPYSPVQTLVKLIENGKIK